jgi:methylenetetrahydrofolate reductase (NADPH)
MSKFRDALASGKFTFTGEIGPPKGTNVGPVIEEAVHYLKDCCVAVNVTDIQTAVMRMSSLAACRMLVEHGVEPVLQMVTRDRNRIALQSDILGASALGIRNILCLSGDHQSFGNQPDAKGVFDIDSVQLVATVRQMRDTAKILGGEELSLAPELFIGAVENPFAEPFAFRVIRLAKKIAAGAEFIQTQCIYNLERFKEFMTQVRDRGLESRAFILGGVTPFKSARMAEYMAKNVAGIDVPEELIKRLKGVAPAEQKKEGLKICVETIQALREMPGVHGIHIMAIEWEDAVPEIVSAAGLSSRPPVE